MSEELLTFITKFNTYNISKQYVYQLSSVLLDFLPKSLLEDDI